MVSSGTTYRRYTNLAAAIHMLRTREITLLAPEKWDDGNDRHFMRVYQDSLGLRTLLAICLAADYDTYGHWRVFSPNVDGICIVLQKDPLLQSFKGVSGIRHRKVDYKELLHLSGPPKIMSLPFLKRYPYKPEGEYRVIYESKTEDITAKSFPLPPGCIKAVILSPWMPEPLVPSVIDTLRSIDGCSELSMYQSTLIKNRRWTDYADSALNDRHF